MNEYNPNFINFTICEPMSLGTQDPEKQHLYKPCLPSFPPTTPNKTGAQGR